MNNGTSNTRGSDMRRLFAFVLLAAFCVAFLSPPASATQYDPNHWPLVHVVNQGTPSGDDTPWGETQQQTLNDGSFSHLIEILKSIVFGFGYGGRTGLQFPLHMPQPHDGFRDNSEHHDTDCGSNTHGPIAN